MLTYSAPTEVFVRGQIGGEVIRAHHLAVGVELPQLSLFQVLESGDGKKLNTFFRVVNRENARKK